MNTRFKNHLSKFSSKKSDIRESSAFYKHLKNAYGEVSDNLKFNECFEVEIVKAYKKPITRQSEEGTFMVKVKGELLNSKTEWHQLKIVRTTIHTGGAELSGGRIISFPVDGSQSTQENRPLPPPPPRRGGQGSASQAGRTPPSPRHGGQGSASQPPVREAPRRSTRKINGQ